MSKLSSKVSVPTYIPISNDGEFLLLQVLNSIKCQSSLNSSTLLCNNHFNNHLMVGYIQLDEMPSILIIDWRKFCLFDEYSNETNFFLWNASF